MRALIYTGPGHAEVADVEVPRIGPDEVLVAARSVGVCHSDIELLEGRYIIPFEYPVVPGHEWAGEVARVGSDVTAFAVGDRVVGECVIGADHFGFSISGAAADFFVARPSWLHRLPDELPWTVGALVEPFSVGYYALLRAGGVDAGDTVVVLGGGPVGLLTAAAAAAMGAATLVVEPSAHRRAAATSLGAQAAVAPEQADEAVDRLTGGRGADLVVEASGHPAVMARSLELVGPGGRVACIGIDVGRQAPAKLGLIQSKELRITGSIGSPGVWPQTLRFLARTGLDLAPLVTERFAAADALDALQVASHPTPTTIKAHVEFSAAL